MSDFSGMEDLLQDFLVEAGDLLSGVDNKLVDLERTPGDKGLLNDIFRGFHTIKGGAGFLNASELVTLCHLTENLFDKLRDHYMMAVKWAIEHRRPSFMIFGGVIVALILLFRIVPGSFVPEEDQGYLFGAVIMPKAASLQRTAILTSDKFKGVRLNIDPGTLRVASNNAEQEEAVDELDIDYGGDSIEIGFNVTYLIDALSNMSQDMVKIDLADSNSSALLTIPDNATFKYVVMPMRI